MQAVEATWPKANVVIGNPPFLGDKMMRSEFGSEYTEALRTIYKDRVPGGAEADHAHLLGVGRHALGERG